MNTLFIVYLGGSAPKANIELHDIQFVTGNTIEDTYNQLRDNWFGSIKGLHIDSYKAINGADGHRVYLHPEPQNSDKHLYFVNLGGYYQNKLNEIHEFSLFVANSEAEAKKRAINSLLVGAAHIHKDNLLDVDDCLKINRINGNYIHLHPSEDMFNL